MHGSSSMGVMLVYRMDRSTLDTVRSSMQAVVVNNCGRLLVNRWGCLSRTSTNYNVRTVNLLFTLKNF